jgi:hypothetical protein
MYQVPPARIRPQSAAPRMAAAAAAAEATQAPSAGPSREVRSAANRAIIKANRQQLDKAARERAVAAEAAAEAECRKKAKWTALREVIMDKVAEVREQRKVAMASLAAEEPPAWMQVTAPAEPDAAEATRAEAEAEGAARAAQQKQVRSGAPAQGCTGAGG